MVSITTALKVTLLLLLISGVTSIPVSKLSENNQEENEVENMEEHIRKEIDNELMLKQQFNNINEQNEKQINESVTKEENFEKTTEKPEANPEQTPEKTVQNEPHKAIDPTASTDTSETARASRTIGRLREVETPATLIESFRNKLKAARSNLEESLATRKAAEPRLFIFDPNADRLKSIPKPTLSSLTSGRTAQQESTPEVKPTDAKKIITSPIMDDSSSSEEHKSGRNSEQTDEINQLLHVREEISKIRHMMQELREQQMQQQFGVQFPNSRNLTVEQTQDLASIIDKLKDQGKISTGALNSELENHPPGTTKLIEDIKKLKESVVSFSKQVGGPKGNLGSIDDLDKRIKEQREEIDSLKKLVDELQPPRTFPVNPVMLKRPQTVKSDLNLEMRNLQDILNELLKKEEQKERLRSAQGREKTNEEALTKKPDEEIGTLMKIFQSITHQANGESRQGLESKLDKLEREMKELDGQNQRTRQEMLLQKLEHDVKSMKSSKFNINPAAENDLKEQIRRLEENLNKQQHPMSSKISALSSQLQQLNKPQSRAMDIPGNIEKELDKLQKEIGLMAMKNMEKSGTPMSSRQLESLFTDILSPPGDDTTHVDAIDKLKGIIKAPLDKLDTLPSKVATSQINHSVHQPIYQLPYCIQSHPHTHPSYPPSNPIHPIPVQTNQQPIKPSGAHETSQTITHQQDYNNGYKQPIKVEEHVEEQGYDNGYKQNKIEEQQGYNQVPAKQQGYKPIKTEQQQSGYGQQQGYSPIKTEQQSGYVKQQGYKPIEEQKPSYGQQQVKIDNRPTEYKPIKIEEQQEEIKPPQNQYGIKQQQQGYQIPVKIPEQSKKTEIIHHVYHQTIPKATPVKIEYQPEETEHQGYEYQPEEMQYQPVRYKPPCSHDADINEEMNHLNGMIGNLDEKIDYSHDLEPNYDVYRSKNYKPRSKREIDDDLDKKQIYMEIKQRLATLREAVENTQDNQNSLETYENEVAPEFQRSANSPDYYQQYDNKDSYPLKIRRKQKFDNLFIKIVKFILHKMEISAPVIVDSLFNGDIFDYDDGSYENNYRMRDADQSEYSSEENYGGMFNNFQGFHGLLGIIPTVLFKLLSNFSSFLNILKRNNFFKNFLFPGGLILGVDGIMALLIWWFSSDENQNLINYQNNYVKYQ